jgi:hypothetical protein
MAGGTCGFSRPRIEDPSESNLLPSVDRRATRWATRAPVCLHPCALPIRMTSERVQDVACNAAVVAKLREKYGGPLKAASPPKTSQLAH